VLLLLAGPGESASRLLANASLAVQRTLGVPSEPLLLDRDPAALVAAAGDAALVVVGVPDRWRSDGLGVTRETLAEEAQAPVVLVRSGLRPGGLAPRESRTRFTWTIKA
jgi:hypothetical protein